MVRQREADDDLPRRLRRRGREAIRLARLGQEGVELDVLDEERALRGEAALHRQTQTALAAALLAEHDAGRRTPRAPEEAVERRVHGGVRNAREDGVLVGVLLDERILVERPVGAPGVREHRASSSVRCGSVRGDGSRAGRVAELRPFCPPGRPVASSIGHGARSASAAAPFARRCRDRCGIPRNVTAAAPRISGATRSPSGRRLGGLSRSRPARHPRGDARNPGR